MSLLARIHANGADVIRDEWRFSLRRGRLSPDAVAWLRARWPDACREVWPLYDDFEERAAIIEFDGGMARQEAESRAYQEVTGC